MFDLSSLPIPGTLIIGGVLYASASIMAGHLVGARTIARMDWVADCEARVQDYFKAEVDRRHQEDSLVPPTDCDSLIGRWHPDLKRLCQELGNPDASMLGGYDVQVARKAEEEARQLERRQLEAAAAGAGSQCECAAAVYAREHLIALALYAGSARMFTPPQVENMESGLHEALSTPLCANYTGGAS